MPVFFVVFVVVVFFYDFDCIIEILPMLHVSNIGYFYEFASCISDVFFASMKQKISLKIQ